MGVMGVSSDISDKNRWEAEILRLNAELEQRVVERTCQLSHSNDHLIAEVAEHRQAKEHLQRILQVRSPVRLKTVVPAGMPDLLLVSPGPAGHGRVSGETSRTGSGPAAAGAGSEGSADRGGVSIHPQNPLPGEALLKPQGVGGQPQGLVMNTKWEGRGWDWGWGWGRGRG